MNDVYSERGFQAYIGYFRNTWPFIKLYLFEDYMQLNMWPLTYVLNYSSIQSTILARSPWFPFVHMFKIIHDNNRIPKDIYYWSCNQEKLREELAKRHLTVSCTSR